MAASDNKLYQLYKRNDSHAISFFRYPLKPDWTKISEAIISNYKHNTFLKVLADQNKHIDNPKYLELLDQKNSVVLVTGQQLGLFVSPLYTVYKILTAILYSQKLSSEIKDYNFVPVFWLEGEDHDFAEINHAYYFNKDGKLSEVVHEENQNEIGFSISKRSISHKISDIIDTLQNNLQNTEFSALLFNDLKKIWKAEKKWNQAFSELIQLIFKDSGLLVFNPADEKVKKLSKPFFHQLIENNDNIVTAFIKQSDLVKDAGFDNQVFVDINKSYIFLSFEGNARLVVQKDGSDHFSIKNSEISWNTEQLLKILDQNPEWFSSTVLTRPIWQSWMLPVVSYIAGPGEIAYWAQLKKGFEIFNVQMPHVMPRFSFTLLEPKIKRLMKKYEIDISEVSGDMNNFIREQIRKTHNLKLENEFHQIKKQLTSSSEIIQNQMDAIDPTLKSVAQKTFENASSTIEKLQNRILRRIEEKESLAVQHFNEIHKSIFPNGNPQERVISSIYFLNKYGPNWLKQMIDQTEMDNFNQQIIGL